MEYIKMQQTKHAIAALLLSLGLLLQSCGASAQKQEDTAEVKAPNLDIHAAVFTGNLNAVKQHIAAKSDLNKKDQFGSTPLAIASTFGKTEIALELIEAGVDLTVQSADGSTALHTAAFFGRTEIVERLLAQNIDLEARNNFDATALESVTAPFDQVRPIYDQLSRDLGPLGLKLDYNQLEEQRIVIADMIEDKMANED